MAAGPENSEFYSEYKKIIEKNFIGDRKRERNLLDFITVSDYAKRKHLLT